MKNVKLNNVRKVYPNGVEAVKGVNFDVEVGEFLILVGPSGCGKSTILRMIAGLEDVSSGEIYFKDEIINDKMPKDRDIGMVFQNYALYPHMTVFENIAFPLKIRKTKKDEIRQNVQQTAELLGLSDYLDRKPKHLSGGQRQRVALGRAIIRKPNIFLFDEPLSNLDAKLRVQMRNEIQSIQRKLGTTTIYVTHDQVEAMTMGTKLVVLNQGEVQQVDTPENIYKDPHNQFVAGFIGSPQMNFFDGIAGTNLINLNIGLRLDINFNDIEDGKPITLGIRPEHIEINKGNGFGFEIIVTNIENLGHEYLIYFEFEEKLYCVRTWERFNINIGSVCSLFISEEKIFIFDMNGNRLK